ncbi:hypothetical protein KC336_g17 [Hortaea werneckii]|nr:hypothetical protein KC336_g17 [Hortaea werneckii]
MHPALFQYILLFLSIVLLTCDSFPVWSRKHDGVENGSDIHFKLAQLSKSGKGVSEVYVSSYALICSRSIMANLFSFPKNDHSPLLLNRSVYGQRYGNLITGPRLQVPSSISSGTVL